MSLIRLHRLAISTILVLSIPCHAMEFPDALTAAVLFFTLPAAVDGITPTSQWVYETTNTQTVLGALGLVTLTFNFLSAYFFYKKTQAKYRKVLRAHLEELERGNEFTEKIDASDNNLIDQVSQLIEREKITRSSAEAVTNEL